MGRRTILHSPEAVSVLFGIARLDGNRHAIQGKAPGRPHCNMSGPWAIPRTRADIIKDVRSHDPRH